MKIEFLTEAARDEKEASLETVQDRDIAASAKRNVKSVKNENLIRVHARKVTADDLHRAKKLPRRKEVARAVRLKEK